MKLLESKTVYHLEFEFIYIYRKENLKGNALKVFFETVKDSRITPQVEVHRHARTKLVQFWFKQPM